MVFPSLGKSEHFVFSVSNDLPSKSKGNAPFCRRGYDYYAGLHGLYLKDAPWKDLFQLASSSAATEFCEWVQVGVDVYIPHRNFQVKPHQSPWFSAVCAVAITHRNHVFRFSSSKIKSIQTKNYCKRALEAAKLVYANKTREFVTSQKFGSRNFWQIANSVLNKGKSGIPPLFNGPEVLSSAFDKEKLFAENFSKNSLPAFHSITNVKLNNIPKLVKIVISNLDSSKAFGLDCIPVVVLKNCDPELPYIVAELFSMCPTESSSPDCWKVSSFKNIGERSTAKNYHLSLLSVVSKIFEKL